MTSKEALEDLIKRNEHFKENGVHIGTKTIDKIRELAERDTPKKPIINANHEITQHNCSVCVCRLDIPQLKEVNFCPKCGQRINWNDEDET